MRRMIRTPFFLLFFSALCPEIAVAQQNPLRCFLEKESGMGMTVTLIRCVATDDVVRITSVLVNRGNCAIPAFRAVELKYGTSQTWLLGCHINDVIEWSVVANGRSWAWRNNN
jgi:hypothetical protein